MLKHLSLLYIISQRNGTYFFCGGGGENIALEILTDCPKDCIVNFFFGGFSKKAKYPLLARIRIDRKGVRKLRKVFGIPNGDYL